MIGSLTWGANSHNAMIAVVARDGRIYFGREQVSANELPAKIRERLNGGAERKVYIKADARARYGAVKAILKAMQSAGVENASFFVDELRGPSRIN